jgi:hypothetical protein
MPVACDTHVHVYPCHSLTALLRNLVANLRAIDAGATPAALLTEGADYEAFADWQRHAESLTDAGIAMEQSPDEACVILRADDGPPIHVFAGRQIVTCERVEILSLLSTRPVADGMPAVETVKAVLDGGGIPVASWAPGKWFPPRSRTIRQLLDTFTPRQLLLGDSSLRATLWPTPVLMAAGRRRGFRVLAGSDPLPFAGDEQHAGTYGTYLEGNLDTEQPVDSLTSMLMTGTTPRTVGRRVSALGMLQRLRNNAKARR